MLSHVENMYLSYLFFIKSKLVRSFQILDVIPAFGLRWLLCPPSFEYSQLDNASQIRVMPLRGKLLNNCRKFSFYLKILSSRQSCRIHKCVMTPYVTQGICKSNDKSRTNSEIADFRKIPLHI